MTSITITVDVYKENLCSHCSLFMGYGMSLAEVGYIESS